MHNHEHQSGIPTFVIRPTTQSLEETTKLNLDFFP